MSSTQSHATPGVLGQEERLLIVREIHLHGLGRPVFLAELKKNQDIRDFLETHASEKSSLIFLFGFEESELRSELLQHLISIAKLDASNPDHWIISRQSNGQYILVQYTQVPNDTIPIVATEEGISVAKLSWKVVKEVIIESFALQQSIKKKVP